MEKADVESLIRGRRSANLGALILGVGPSTYLLGLMLELSGDQRWQLLCIHLVMAFGLYRMVLAMPLQRRLMRQALARSPGEAPGHRLARLLELPQRLHLLHLGLLTAVQVGACIAYGFYFERPGLVLPCAVVQVLLSAFMLLVHLPWVEDSLHAHVVEEFHLTPKVRLASRALLWRRLSWQLPYTLGLTLACALAVPCALLSEQLPAWDIDNAPVLGVCALMGALGVLSIWHIARQLARGTRRLQRSLELAAAGIHQPPDWFSTDELGRLTTLATRALLRLDKLAHRLRGSALQLEQSAAELGTTQAQQRESLARQVAALEQAREQAHQLQEDSEVSERTVEALLGLADRAEVIHQSGRVALQQGLQSLSSLHSEARALATRLHSLQEAAGQLSKLTGLVGDLANRSRMLAFNASVEVASAGEGGQEFSRVADQVRSLAEHSLRSTRQVQTHLQEMLDALQQAVRSMQEGAASAAEGVEQVQASGEALRQMAAAAEESAGAVRQIAQVLGRQNEGITRLSQAVSNLSHVSAETLEQLESSTEVPLSVNRLARQVRSAVAEREEERRDGARPRAVRIGRRLLLGALLLEQQLTLLLWLIPSAVLGWMLLGLEADVAWEAALEVVAPLCGVCGVLLSLLWGPWLVKWTLVPPAGLSPEQRLRRILELPRRQGVVQTLSLTAVGLVTLGVCRVKYAPGAGVLAVLGYGLLLLLLAAFASVPSMLRLEDRVRPLAVELFHRHPEVELPWRWPFWRSLSWYLPYLIALTVVCVLSAVAAAVWHEKGEASLWLLVEALVLPGALLLLQALRITGWLARQVARGTQEIEASLESIAHGTPRLPGWVSTDELGSLSLATAAIVQELWKLNREAQEANGQLERATQVLGASQLEQAQGLSRQAEVLDEVLATVREVEQDSALAANRTAGMLATAERGREIRHAGEAALEQALNGLAALRAQVSDMAEQLGTLEEHARPIGTITALLRELARECDIVALNATIPAVHAGERGRVFVVIARELRALAERSGRATREADVLLEGFTRSAREVSVSARERAVELQAGLEQAHRSAEELRQLSTLVEEYRTSAWRIAAAIRQQNADISRVSETMGEVARTTRELTEGLEVSGTIAGGLADRL
jgi:methyl-accepting chemotaxis protein